MEVYQMKIYLDVTGDHDGVVLKGNKWRYLLVLTCIFEWDYLRRSATLSQLLVGTQVKI